MRNRARRLCLLSLALAALAPVAPAAAQQNTWTGVQRIVAVGDVHGDCDQFVKVLRAADVIDANTDWKAGKTHLVQIGDVLDRGPDSRQAMDLLMKLEQQAARAGGAVHALLGNHEAMVLLDDWRYVHPGELKAFGGPDAYRKAMGAAGKYGRWIRTHNTIIRINDLLFVHAGVAPALARMSMEQVNKKVRQELSKGDTEGIASAPSGPLWTRSLALGDEDEVAERLAGVLAKYGAGRMVIGHTVSYQGIVSQAGGRLIRIDVGMSSCYGGPAECLVVDQGVLYKVRHPRLKERLPLKPVTTRPAATQPARVTLGAVVAVPSATTVDLDEAMISRPLDRGTTSLALGDGRVRVVAAGTATTAPVRAPQWVEERR